MLVSGRGERNLELRSYAGLARRSPFLGAILALFLLSLAGIPPTAGFIAKVTVFSAAISSGHWSLVLIAVLASVIAAFFYIRVIVLTYMQDPEDESAIEPAPLPAVGVALPALLTLALGVFPSILFDVLKSASVIRF
jgi:NADH-quinone oxidoreductase subunit N